MGVEYDVFVESHDQDSVFGSFMTSVVVILVKFAFAFACEWETVDISISGHFWPPATGMICVR